mmetsp:Transcript_27399/g.61905  ORF Transcript_27399/g.61905 Transcript_27399/m.61905 type:complete len:90 (+) Transcript_27399:1043-1312(+)
MFCPVMNTAMCIANKSYKAYLTTNILVAVSFKIKHALRTLTECYKQEASKPTPDRQELGLVGFYDTVCWSNKWSVTLAMNPGQLPCSLT